MEAICHKALIGDKKVTFYLDEQGVKQVGVLVSNDEAQYAHFVLSQDEAKRLRDMLNAAIK